MNRFDEIKAELKEAAEHEAMKWWRIARKAQERGCSSELVTAIREEANTAHINLRTFPDRMLTWDFQYKYKYIFH